MITATSRIKGSSILIVSDLHLSDKFQGQHKDYLGTCRDIMEQILTQVEGNSCSGLILLGDVFGVKEKRFTSRTFFLEVYKWLTELNRLTRNNVYSVQGNHDISHNDLSDFDVFVSFGLLKRVSHLDLHDNQSEDAGVRFHFVDYGHELRELSISAALGNVALTHNDFGLPNQPRQGWMNPKAFDLSQMTNFLGIDLVIGGHIHTPPDSPSYVTQTDGTSLILYYPGNPTRVSQHFEECASVLFTFQSGEVVYNLVPFDLKPPSEEFLDSSEETQVDSSIEDHTLDTLKGIVGSLSAQTLAEGSLLKQIENRKDVTPRVRELSVGFLKDALNAS